MGLNKYKKMRMLVIIMLALLLSACGFRARSSKDVPPQLYALYLKTPNPYSQFTTSLRGLLRSVDIRLVKSPQEASYHLLVTNTSYTHSNPGLAASNTPVQFTFSYTARAKLVNTKGKPVVPPRGFAASRTLLLNLNQVYTPAAGQLAKPDLERDVISQIFSWLTSENTHKALLAKPKRSSKRKRYVKHAAHYPS